MRITKTILVTSIASIAMPFESTSAQTAPGADKVDEIVVTARRVSETLSSVPASITGDGLSKRGDPT
ncbi:MAG: hypothetical protein IPP88_13785 [Betaproteobacteria bacterium]|nr:hypothetical protein [Betaproteobacteria bacterium]